METKILNYRIILKKEKETRKTIFVAECPTLGIYDWGDTLDLALSHIKEAIECHIASLLKDGEEIPVDYTDKEFVTETKIIVPITSTLSS